MQYHLINVNVDKDVVMEEIPNIMLMIIILQTHKIRKPRFNLRSGKGPRKKTEKIYRVNPLRFRIRLVIDAELKGIGHVSIVQPNI